MNETIRGVCLIYNWRNIFGLALVILGLFATGCSTIGRGGAPAETQDLTVNIALDKSAYRPGEAMVMTVTLTNVSLKEQPVHILDAQSLEFWFHLAGSPDTPIRREPVRSSQSQRDRFRAIAPGEATQREFLLTRMTHFKGSMVVQVHYKQGIPYDAMKTNKIYSNVAEYEVHGEPLFEREDAAGIIVKDAAIALARAQCPDKSAIVDTQALLVEDEMGFYCYWVNLKVKDAQGADSLVSYLVDPYWGRVKGQAKPFDPRTAEDPRWKRPGLLPKTGIPTQQVGGDR